MITLCMNCTVHTYYAIYNTKHMTLVLDCLTVLFQAKIPEIKHEHCKILHSGRPLRVTHILKFTYSSYV